MSFHSKFHLTWHIGSNFNGNNAPSTHIRNCIRCTWILGTEKEMKQKSNAAASQVSICMISFYKMTTTKTRKNPSSHQFNLRCFHVQSMPPNQWQCKHRKTHIFDEMQHSPFINWRGKITVYDIYKEIVHLVLIFHFCVHGAFTTVTPFVRYLSVYKNDNNVFCPSQALCETFYLFDVYGAFSARYPTHLLTQMHTYETHSIHKRHTKLFAKAVCKIGDMSWPRAFRRIEGVSSAINFYTAYDCTMCLLYICLEW